jgi:hypothetical protein
VAGYLSAHVSSEAGARGAAGPSKPGEVSTVGGGATVAFCAPAGVRTGGGGGAGGASTAGGGGGNVSGEAG